MREKLISLLCVLSVLFAFLAYTLVSKYLIAADKSSAWMDSFFFIYFLCVMMGVLGVLEWEVLFLDWRDQENLNHLPIHRFTLFLAKLLALLLFTGLFSLALNALSPLVFSFYLIDGKAGLGRFFHFLGAHLLVCACACIFIFLLLTIAVGLLCMAAGHRHMARISPYIRGFLLSFLILQMVFFFALPGPVLHPLLEMDLHQTGGTHWLHFFPPFWFVGLYQTLLGNQAPVFQEASQRAVLLMLVTPGLFLLVSYWGQRRLLVSFRDLPAFPFRRRRSDRRFTGLTSLIAHRNSIQMAVLTFFRHTLARSMIHKMHLLSLLVLNLGLAAIGAVFIFQQGIDIHQPHPEVLAIPLVVVLILLVGFKNLVSIPYRPAAHWIFRLTAKPGFQEYRTGLIKALIWYVLVPVSAGGIFLFGMLWGWAESLLFALFLGLTGRLLCEVLFWRFRKIPFTCTYLPGRAKLHIYAILYFLAFWIYTGLMSTMASFLIKNPPALLVFSLVTAAVLRITEKIQMGQRSGRPQGLLFEEEPDPVLLSLRA